MISMRSSESSPKSTMLVSSVSSLARSCATRRTSSSTCSALLLAGAALVAVRWRSSCRIVSCRCAAAGSSARASRDDCFGAIFAAAARLPLPACGQGRWRRPNWRHWPADRRGLVRRWLRSPSQKHCWPKHSKRRHYGVTVGRCQLVRRIGLASQLATTSNCPARYPLRQA